MTGPENHARFLSELEVADEELNPWWAPRIERTTADRICGAIEKWAFVTLFLLCAAAFMACAGRWWWCGLLAIGSLGCAGVVARFYGRLDA